MESDDVSFRSHVHSTDHGVCIVVDTALPLLKEGLLSLRMKRGTSPEQVHALVEQLREQVDRIEFHLVVKPVFEKV